MEHNSFFDQPYIDRQLIIFVDDDAIAAVKKAGTSEYGEPAQGKDGNRFVKFAKDVLIASVLPSMVVTTAIIDLMQSYKEVKKEGVENLLPVAKSQIASFQLPPGHPRDRIVYVGHPAMPSIYVPLADFHRLTFEHKFSEAVSLLMSLGAKTLRVERVTGWGTDFSSHLNIGLPSTIGSIDANAEAQYKQKTQNTLLFEAELENSQYPAMPENLVWYPYESIWQQIANGRLKFGLKNFNLSLNYNDDYGINAGLKLKIDKAGFDAGGSFERHVATTWNISGHF